MRVGKHTRLVNVAVCRESFILSLSFSLYPSSSTYFFVFLLPSRFQGDNDDIPDEEIVKDIDPDAIDSASGEKDEENPLLAKRAGKGAVALWFRQQIFDGLGSDSEDEVCM